MEKAIENIEIYIAAPQRAKIYQQRKQRQHPPTTNRIEKFTQLYHRISKLVQQYQQKLSKFTGNINREYHTLHSNTVEVVFIRFQMEYIKCYKAIPLEKIKIYRSNINIKHQKLYGSARINYYIHTATPIANKKKYQKALQLQNTNLHTALPTENTKVHTVPQ